MSGIKQWSVPRGVTVSELCDGDYILHTDHLAAMAAASTYDEEKERALFEGEFHYVSHSGSYDSWVSRWKYTHEAVDSLWFGWLACAKQDNEDLKRAWQAGHDTAWYGKNPAHERGSVPVAKQVVMPERKWLQSDGLIYSLKSGVNYYEINVTQVEGSRHNAQRAEFARKLIDLLNAAPITDHSEDVRAMVVPDKAILVGRAELSLVRNALKLDCEQGRSVRGEMLTALDNSTAKFDAILAASPSAKGGE